MSDAAQRRVVAVRLVVLAAWCGLTWSLGAVVAPTLFAVMPSRALAGDVAGTLFRIHAWASIALGAVWCLLAVRARVPRKDLGIAFAMLACVIVAGFALPPAMAAMREAVRTGIDPGAASRFAALHGTAAALHLAQSILGIWLVARHGRG